jgi:(2Fe-2S) ferredoxin
VLAELQRQAAERGLDDVDVKSYLCFGGCSHGPNLVVYPQKVWYAGVKKEDAGEILDAAASGGTVDRLTGKVDKETQELIYQLLDTGLF